jgi:DDB1- and CUL4-associated factor 13
VDALDTHADSVTCLARNPRAAGILLSGAADGEVLVWDVPSRKVVASLRGHRRAVRGVACAPDGRHAASVGDDAVVCLWQLPGVTTHGTAAAVVPTLPTASCSGKHAFRDVDYHWTRLQFATAGATVQIWDHERSEPVAEYTWGVDAVSSVRFNPAEPDLFATCGTDRRYATYQ